MAFQINLVSIPGNATLNLADGINYSIDDEEGTFTAFMVPPEQGIGRITETITVNVLGGNSTNQAVRRKTAADNLNALTSLLRTIKYGGVSLEIVPPYSQPPKKYTATLLNWLPEVYLPDVVAAENLPSGVVNRVTITYERRSPWLWEWLNDNVVSGTTTMSAITTPALAGVTRSDVAGTMAWGGSGYMQLTKTGAGAANTYLNLGYACTNGVPITFSIGTSFTNITQLDILLVSLGPVTGRSNLVSATIHTDAINNGTRFTATLTPTFTGTLYPYFQIYGSTGATVRFTEPMWQLGTVLPEDTAWHVSQALELRPATVSAGTFTPALLTFNRAEATLSPQAFTITYPSSSQPTSGLLWMSPPVGASAGVQVQNLPSASPLATGFSSVAEAAGNRAMTNDALRCTATAATTYVQPLSYGTQTSRTLLVIVLRNNAATNQWIVSIRIRPNTASGGIGTTYYESRPIFPAADSQYRIYVFGEVATPFEAGTIELVVTSNAASGTIDFDRILYSAIGQNTCLMTHGGAPAVLTALNFVPNIPRGYSLINDGDIVPFDDPLLMTQAASVAIHYTAVAATAWSPPTGNITYSVTRYQAAEHVS